MSTVDHTFSLIVNTIDRAGPLRALLYGLEQQSYPHFEVIVVVGPTHDNTLEMLTEFGERVRILRCPTANLSQSRNIGLLGGAGRHCRLHRRRRRAQPTTGWRSSIASSIIPNWQEPVARFTASPQTKASSNIASASPLVWRSKTMCAPPGWMALCLRGWATNGFGRMMGTNMAYRRRDLLEVGGFDEFYQWVYDDTDIALRLTNAGKLVHPVKEAVVYHAPASSRNRQVNTVRGNWWIQTKAAFYFSIKNGPIGGNSRREIPLRCLHLWHGHLLWYGQMRRARKITIWQYGKMFSLEARGALSGAYHGWRRNSYSAPTLPQSMTNSSEPIQPFQDANSATQAAVDPINGRRPTITIPDQPLRICLMSMAYPPHQYEGVGRLTNLMARGLFELGHTVHVITRSSQGSAEAVSFYDGAYVHQIPGQRNRYAAYRPYPRLFNLLNYSHAVNDQVRRLMLNDGVQVADTPLWQMDGLVTAVSNTIPTLVRLVTAAKQISDLQQEQNTDARLLGEMERTLIQRAHHVAPNTQATLNNVRKVYNVDLPDGRFTLLPYGIVPAPEEAVQPFPLPAPPPTLRILYVGRLEKRKGILDLFAAIPRILQKVPYARFTIVGGDNSEQDGFQRRKGLTYPQYFQQQHPQLAPYVQFTGAVSDEDLQKHYHSCDLFVAPSLYESFGLIYLEAMNYAKPVIGCRAGGIPEVIDEGVTGLLAEPGDPDSLTEAILTLAQSPTKLYEMGLAGRQQLLSRFSHVQMAERFATVYRQMIAAWRSEQETQNL
jgi:glycosyltransferase involved in cell wall biosynthesis